MKELNYFFVLKFPVLIVPAAMFVQPEHGLVFGDNNLFMYFRHNPTIEDCPH
jgi:hypothetical protein